MTPFHVLFSAAAAESSQDLLLQALLDRYPYHVLGWKDANDKLAMEYLVNNWTRGNKMLLQMALHRWMLDPLIRWWGTTTSSWTDDMQRRIQAILVEDHVKRRRMKVFVKACSVWKQYQAMEVTSILEMAVWKGKLKGGGRSNNGAKRQVLDREACRCVCGSNIVIPSIVLFLGIQHQQQ